MAGFVLVDLEDELRFRLRAEGRLFDFVHQRDAHGGRGLRFLRTGGRANPIGILEMLGLRLRDVVKTRVDSSLAISVTAWALRPLPPRVVDVPISTANTAELDLGGLVHRDTVAPLALGVRA